MLSELFTLYWWLGILGALLLSVVGVYLTRFIDAILGSFSSKWKRWAKRRRDKFDAVVDLHLSDPQLISLSGFDMTICSIRAFVLLIMMAIVMLDLHLHKVDVTFPHSPILTLLVIVFTTTGAFLDLFRASKLSRLLGVVKRRRIVRHAANRGDVN